jgi:predicted  nucleic acid-binding Zn-ribbon protein
LEFEGAIMKAKKVLKQIAKIEALMSKATERCSPPIQELLRDAKAAITRAKKAVGLESSSWTAKKRPAKDARNQVAAKKATPVKAAKALPREVAKAKAKKDAVKAAKPPARKVAKKAPVTKAAVKARPIKL